MPIRTVGPGRVMWIRIPLDETQTAFELGLSDLLFPDLDIRATEQ
ncbi:hypothetical protein ACWEQL_28915 [Kitasatospora sp. NPDC004240]